MEARVPARWVRWTGRAISLALVVTVGLLALQAGR